MECVQSWADAGIRRRAWRIVLTGAARSFVAGAAWKERPSLASHAKLRTPANFFPSKHPGCHQEASHRTSFMPPNSISSTACQYARSCCWITVSILCHVHPIPDARWGTSNDKGAALACGAGARAGSRVHSLRPRPSPTYRKSMPPFAPPCPGRQGPPACRADPAGRP